MRGMCNRQRRLYGKRLISMVLIFALLLGLIPQSAYATGTASTTVEQEYVSEGCTITYKETSAWSNYVNAEIVIKNETDSDKSLWQLQFVYDGLIENIWNADIVSSEDGKYEITAKSYNSTIAAGQSVSFGFTAYGTESKPEVPERITYATDVTSDGNTGNNNESTGTGSGTSTEEGTTGGGEAEGDATTGQDYGIPEQWKGLNYALFTSGEEGLSFYTNTTSITGSVHTNEDFFYQGNSLSVDGVLEAGKGITLKTSDSKDSQKVSAKVENADTVVMPDITKELYAYVKENGTIYDTPQVFDGNNIVIDTPIGVEGSATFHGSTFLGKGIVYAKESIAYNVGSMATPDDSWVLVATENGNITLNGSDIALNAVLYAPKGCVYVNANSIHLRGRIIAKQICINGTMLQIEAGIHDYDMLDFLFSKNLDIEVNGDQKVNRKVTLSVVEDGNGMSGANEDITWFITKGEADASDCYVIDEASSTSCYQELYFKEAGTYQVHISDASSSQVITKELVILEDMSPIAGFQLESDCYMRNEEGVATIHIADSSFSPDGDEIGTRKWIVYYDENNDGSFDNDEATVLDEGNQTEIDFETEHVGKYKVFLEITETYENAQAGDENVFLKDDTSEFVEQKCVFEVGNEAPVATVDIEKSKSADIVFTVGEVDGDVLETYQAKAEELKETLQAKGIDAKIEVASSSVLTAQDTFAWKEYSHYNTDFIMEHIVYEEKDIKMLGYHISPMKDFLYVADDNPNKKIFDFDIKRDDTDWHSMEGGGFLFNTTVDDDANTIKGFCVLLTQSGLKLVRIDCDQLFLFRHGSYNWVQYAGELLKTYPIEDVYANHHIKIVADSKTVSVWVDETKVIDNFVLPEQDSGYGFGPITSFAQHECSQRSYFTFKNIRMETVTGASLSDIVNGYDWRPGASHYVINLSNKEVPELASEEETADLAAALINSEAAFIGIGNETNETQYSALLNATQTGGLVLPSSDVKESMNQGNDYITESILAKEYGIETYITTDDIVHYKGYYQDAENDELYSQQWEYEYDPSVFTTGVEGTEHIVRESNEPITVFENTGAYVIRLRVCDNPVEDNEALAEYRRWSGTEEYKKLLLVQSRPKAMIDASVTKNASDNTTCIANVSYSSEDPDHLDDETKGIRKEYFWYKNVKDGAWTEGKLPNSLTVGETYLVKYQVQDQEGTLSFLTTKVVKTRDLLEYEEIQDVVKPEICIDVAKHEIEVGEQLRIDGYALDDYGVQTFCMYIDGEQVLDSFGRYIYIGGQVGDVKVKAVATDIGGNTAEKEIVLHVLDATDKISPTAMITTPLSGADISFNVQIKGTAKDETELLKYTLSYREKNETEYHVFHESTQQMEEDILGTLDISSLQDGEYEILLTVEDTAGNKSYYGIILYIDGDGAAEDEADKEFIVTLSHSATNPGTEVQVQVTVPDYVQEETLKIYMDGTEIASGTRKTTFVADKAGKVEIKATGTTEDGEEVVATATCDFYNLADENPPIAYITYPVDGQILTEPVNVVGMAGDVEGLDSWKLEYRLKDTEEYQLLAEGKKSKEDEVLAQFDTTMLMNGQYEVMLTAEDQGGNVTKITKDYVVEGNLKVGAMHIGFTDVTAKMGGTTVSVNRVYDSRNKVQGDFGYGWTLGMQGMEIAESGNIAEGYQLVQSGSAFSTAYQMTETISHDVVVTYGDGTSDRFELTFTPERKALIPISEVELGYKCVTNQKVKLEIVQDSTAYVAGSELSFYNEEMYGTLDYKLTTEEGNEIYLNKKVGVYKIVDTSDNVITVDEDGYHSEDGKSITFTRDEEGRVVKTEDPSGKTITYEYDKAGDLVSVTDAADRTVTFTYDKQHNLASITDPSGVAVARNEYDENGRLVATIDAEGNRTEYAHDVEGRTELITDRLGNKTLYIYDDNGNVLSTTDANGNTTKSTYDSFGNVLTKTDANGNVTSYSYDENGNVTTVTDASGNSVENVYNKDNLITSMKTVDDTEILIDYDKNGLLSETTDAEGNKTSYTNDSKGNVTGMADEIGTVMTAKYDKNGNAIETTDSAGNKTVNTFDDAGNRLTQTTYAVTEKGTVERTTCYVYNDAGELVQTIDADGNSTSVERNANGQMSASVDSKGRRTEYRYDQFGNVVEILYSDGTTEIFEYDAEGRNTKTISRTGLVTTYSYDKVGNLLTQTDARGNVTSYSYDKNYNVKTITSPTGAVTTYCYDELNRNTSIEDSQGNVISFTYNALSLQTSTTDAKGNVTTFEYDKNGNRTKVIYPDGSYAATKYDERGRTIWQQDSAGRETKYIYDDSDRLVEVKQNHGAVTRYAYDQTGNLVSIEDANGNVTTYMYDENARRIKVILPDGAESTSEYDNQGMLLSTTDYNGVTTAYSYDEEDRLVKETTGEEFKHYIYDSFGRLTDVETADSHISYTYNKYGELYYKTYENGQKVVYGYDQYGRNNEIRVTQNGTVLSSTKYEFDTMSRLTRVVGHDGTAVVYSYDANGNREKATYANGVVLTYSYDECNRLILQKVVDKSGKAIAQYNYTLGEGGERTKVTEEGPEGTIETAYEYDKAGRLTKETIQKGEETTTYQYKYDSVGNRIEKRVNSDITKYTYNSRNQLVEEDTLTGTVVYSYDANGNLLNQSGAGKASIYTYDLYNRLIQYVEGSKKESYSYDAEGVRRSKVNSEETICYVSDTTGSLSYTLAEADEEGNAIASYTRVDALISQARGEERSYYLFDGHGDVRGLLDTEGNVTDTYRYNAYGELLERSGDTENHYLYTGEYYDGTSNLYYLRARYMNPSVGTFISMDTYEGSIYDPDTLHKYLYANGNPVKYTDPTGNFFSGIGSFMATTIQTTINNAAKLHVLGVISGVTSSAIATFLGASPGEAMFAFAVGYIGGFGMGAILCVAAAYSVVIYAQMLMLVTSTNALMVTTALVYSILEKKEKQTIVLSVLSIAALLGFYKAYSLYGTIMVNGDRGSFTIGFDNKDPDNPSFNGQKLNGDNISGNKTKQISGASYDINKLKKTQPYTDTNKVNAITEHIAENGPNSIEPIRVRVHKGVVYIEDGHHRYEAFKQLGYDRVPIKYLHSSNLGRHLPNGTTIRTLDDILSGSELCE